MDCAVAVVQTRPAAREVAGNLDRALTLVAEAAAEGAEVVVLPEHFATGYDLDAAGALAEPPGGRVENALQAAAKEHDIVLVTALPVREPNGLATVALVHTPDGATHRRRKRRLFAGERRRLIAGEPPAVARSGVATLAPLVCYELEFPEDARAAARAGAHLLAVPSAFTTPRIWDLATRARALENGVFLAAANLGSPHCGASRIVAPDGQILASVDGREGVAVARARWAAYDAWRADHPYLQDLALLGEPRAGELEPLV